MDKIKILNIYAIFLEEELFFMNVEKMIKRDISVEIANYLTNNLPCYEKKNIDDEKTYETNFLHLMNVIGKNVINTVTSTLLQIEYPNQSTNIILVN